MDGLVRLLRRFPRHPRFSFDSVDLLQDDLALEVEVADRRLAPLRLDLFEVDADGGLFNPHALGNGHLGIALEVQVGHLLSAAVDRDLAGAADGHLCGATYIARSFQASSLC
jgi:hypothetical protein